MKKHGNNSGGGGDRLTASTLTLPPSDPRDAAVKELDAMCRELIETVHEAQRIERETNRNERMLGRLEERIYTMTDAIHARQRDLYLNEGINIAISHTVEGLPIRVDRARRLNLYGAFGG